MKDKIYMNDYYNEPEIITIGNIQDLENLVPENYREITTKSEHLLNQEIETDYHNTYYLGNGKYGHRTLKMNNQEYLKLNK